MKAVIPAAGFGTRFLPIAKAVPKEMLPLGDRPVIHWVVEEAVQAGFDEILVVISKGKESLVEYFTPNPALEAHLKAAGKSDALDKVRNIPALGKVQFVWQQQMRGLGDAVLHGKDFVGEDEIFAVLLGDTVMQNGSPLPAMRKAWEDLRMPSVSMEPCPEEKVSRYGVAGGHQKSEHVFQLDKVIEKPRPEVAPRLFDPAGSPLPFHAFAARYVFTPEIFGFLEKTSAGFGGEIQLTDAMETLRQTRGLLGVTWSGKRLDIGNPSGLIEAAKSLGG